MAGPTIGGWLTDNGPLLGNLVTNETRWRWVFYINLPLGAVALLALLVYLPANLSLHKKSRVGKVTLRNIDVLGALLAAAATICLLLGLTWGGDPAYGWSSSLVISLLVAAGLLLLIAVTQLEKSPLNARRTGGKTGMDELKASLLAHAPSSRR